MTGVIGPSSACSMLRAMQEQEGARAHPKQQVQGEEGLVRADAGHQHDPLDARPLGDLHQVHRALDISK